MERGGARTGRLAGAGLPAAGAVRTRAARSPSQAYVRLAILAALLLMAVYTAFGASRLLPAECERAGRDEGLLRDTEGQVVSATAANLLLLHDGRWTSPPVDRCGVAGVLRGWLLEQGLAEIAAASLDDVESADALALCNAVRGILPVSSLGARAWPPHPATHDLQARLAMAYPMFTTSMEVA